MDMTFINGFMKVAKPFLPMVEKKHDTVLKGEVRGSGQSFDRIKAFPGSSRELPGLMTSNAGQFLTSQIAG